LRFPADVPKMAAPYPRCRKAEGLTRDRTFEFPMGISWATRTRAATSSSSSTRAQDEVGYRFRDGIGGLVARREVTVIGRRGRKTQLVEIPIGNVPGLPVGAEYSAS
jgi:hypothetical protein